MVHEVRAGAGFLAGVQVVDEVRGDDVAQECVRRGVLTRTIHANTLQICPPFVTTEDEVQLVATTVADALDTF